MESENIISNRKERRKERRLLNAPASKFNIPKIFLALSISIGILMSFAMPLFNESDGQYHFVDSTNLVGLTTDITSYGESKSSWTGTVSVKDALQNRDYFERYFVQKVHPAKIQDLPRLNKISPVLNYDFLGHLIPAAGVWLGYQIYPSMGVMIIVARLFQTLVSSLIIFFILKKLKFGQLLFAAVSLSPTIMNQMTSLSYDTTSYLFVAGIIAYAINASVKEKLSTSMVIGMLAISIFSFYFLKTNFILVLALFPIVLLSIYLKNRKKKRVMISLPQNKVVRSVGLVVLGLVILGIANFVTAGYGGIFSTLGRLALNFTYFWADSSTLSRNIIQVFAAPRGLVNHVPMYATGLWIILITIILLSEEKLVKSKMLAVSALLLFLGGIAAVYYGYFSMNYDSTPRGVILGEVAEMQGRYFTPTVLLLPLVISYEGFKLKLSNQNTVATIMIVVTIFTNALLVFGTWFALINT